MNIKYRLIILLILIIVAWKYFQYLTFVPGNNQNETPTGQLATKSVKVTVYYEALCSDSRNFIIKQLQPAYDYLHEYIILDLVPYGKAETIEKDGQITFKCQHAAIECLANKIHACVLDEISDPALQLKYVACMINDNMIPHEAGERCGRELNFNYDPISQCVDGTKGSILLKHHGERTHAVTPMITFIPTVELDGYQKVPLAHILKDFAKELCSLLSPKPVECV